MSTFPCAVCVLCLHPGNASGLTCRRVRHTNRVTSSSWASKRCLISFWSAYKAPKHRLVKIMLSRISLNCKKYNNIIIIYVSRLRRLFCPLEVKVLIMISKEALDEHLLSPPPWSVKISDFPSCSFCSRHTGLLDFLPWVRLGGGGALLPQGLCMCLECPPPFYPNSQMDGLLSWPSYLLWGHLPSLPIGSPPQPCSLFFFCLFFSIALVII